MAENECRRGRNYTYFINFVPYFGQLMSVHRLKYLARCLIVTKTSFHAGFWCLSRIKRSTRSPNQKTFGDVCHLWLPFSALLGTCGLLSRAANLWSETNFFRDSNPCGLHSRASYNPTNTVCERYNKLANKKTLLLIWWRTFNTKYDFNAWHKTKPKTKTHQTPWIGNVSGKSHGNISSDFGEIRALYHNFN